MNQRFRIYPVRVLLLMTISASAAMAQAPATPTLDEQVDQLKTLVTQLQEGQNELKLETEAIQAQLSNTQKDMASVASAMGSLDSQMNEIRQLLRTQTETLQALADVQQRLRPADERPELNSGQSDPTQPPSPARRPAAGRGEGVIRIHNEMTSDQTIAINGLRYRVPAQSIMEIACPLGTATTELIGFEAPKQWTISKPGHVQEINIYPTDRSVVQNVSSPTPAERTY